MSYTRSYSASVEVHGSTTVSYPASEHGGVKTVYYTDTVPVNVNIIVETAPFDGSIASAGAHVDGLTASVAAMNAANCASIAQCSDQISNSLIGGFYSLIQSDISTKKAENNTAVQTKSALLLEHSKAVQDKHHRMLTDVERERAKFGKIFNELDKELERRIVEINKPAFTLGHKIREQIVVEPYLSSAAKTADQLGAGNCTGGTVAAAGIRQKVLTVIRNLSSSLHNNLLYRHMMHDILWDKSISNERQMSYIPAAYCISEDIKSGHKFCQCYVSENPSRDDVIVRVRSYVNENSALEAKAIPDDEMRLIDQAFSNIVQDSFSGLAERSEYQERVFTEICRLWKDNCQGLKQV